VTGKHGGKHHLLHVLREREYQGKGRGTAITHLDARARDGAFFALSFFSVVVFVARRPLPYLLAMSFTPSQSLEIAPMATYNNRQLIFMPN